MFKDSNFRTEAMAELEEAITMIRKAVNATPEDHPDRAGRLNNLGLRLGQRYSRTGAMADLQEAIVMIRKAINATPEDHPDQAIFLSNLGLQLGHSYLRTGAMTDLEEAITVSRKVVDATPEDHPDWAGRLNNLGLRLGQRYSRTGVMADLQEAIIMVRKAINAAPEDHPDQAIFFSNLGSRLGQRYLSTGEIADLDEALQLAWAAVNATPDDHPDRAGRFNNVAIRLGDRYSRTGAMADLEEAIRLGWKAVHAQPVNSPNQAMFLSNLGSRLGDRYSRTGAMADLEEAIHVGRLAVNATPVNHPNRGPVLNNLRNQLGRRYSRTGVITDLEEATQVALEALRAVPDSHCDRAGYLSNLGNQLRDRHSRAGAMADLEEAIRVGREAVHASLDRPDRAMHLTHLGNGLSLRYLRTRAIADIEEAVQVGRAALDATPNNHPNRVVSLNNISSSLGHLYSQTRTLAHLEDALRLAWTAVNTMSEDHPARATCLRNLGHQLGHRYLTTGELADLEKTIQVRREALSGTPDDHPDRATALNDLGNALSERYLKTGATTDLEEAIIFGQSALSQLNAVPLVRIRAGQMVLRNCAVIADWQQAFEASRVAIYLIPKLTPRSLQNSDKQHFLARVVGLASDAAAAALNAGKEPLHALDLLEQGRGVLAASLEAIRRDLLDLQQTHPELSEQFVRLRDVLDQPAALNTASMDEHREFHWQAQGLQRSEADAELDKLIIKIRSQPGFGDFLSAPSEEEMKLAAKYGPIVAINTSQYRCDAILIENHQIRSLALPKLTSEGIKERAKKGYLGSPEVLEWLWNDIMDPILNALGFRESPTDGNWPHVWWIPTGTLSKFPLHAAGHHQNGSRETVLDRVMSSYSSSVKAIIHSRRRPAPLSTPVHALLVAMEHTPGGFRLPFAAKEGETLHDLCKSMRIDPIQPGRRKQDVTLHLPRCTIFHFAGHGHTDEADPSKSHLLLEEGNSDPLTVANLLEMNLREHSPFLAYLSACGTGQIRDEKLIDESIHLISAFQLAGFRHVIGTLWEVNDEICVDMARITYEGIRDGCMNDEAVCRGLHNAVRELRDRWLNLPLKARREVRSSRKVCASLGKRKPEIGMVNDRGERDDRLSRDAVLCNTDTDDDGTEVESLLWVPYIHFGV
ncbi:hypothetical protein IFM5058_10514 [Aspergillus udagawae]|nr:hypothetical protein IFM5058_10514 [Aspergillus udagawae]